MSKKILFVLPGQPDKLALLKSHVASYTRKDGTFVGEHDDKRQAKAGPFAVAPFKHGGHQVTNGGKHHVILQDERVARQHAEVMNHVSAAGKTDHMDASVHEAAKKHMGVDHLETKNSDSEDFVDTGKAGTKAALEHAYNAGAGGDNPKLRAHRDAIVNESAKHFLDFDSLKEAKSDREDFKENSRMGIKLALSHAYAHGAKMAGEAKPKATGGSSDKSPSKSTVIDHSAVGHYLPQHKAKIDAMKDGETISVRAGDDVHRLTRKGDKVHAELNPPKAAKKGDAPLHHKDLKEGDELIDPKGEKHEYSHTEQGLGRKKIQTRAGYSFPTEKDGTLPGWKKTGKNNAG